MENTINSSASHKSQIICNLDTPTLSSIKIGTINPFVGWAFLVNGQVIEKIQVMHNDEVLGVCKYGLTRDDVFNDYKRKESINSGFMGDIFIPSDLTSSLRIIAIDSKGGSHEIAFLNIQDNMFKQHILDGDFDLAKLEPAILVDAIYRSMFRNRDGNKSEDDFVPSYSARSIVAGSASIWFFGFEGGQTLAFSKMVLNLNSKDRVLDIGCGCGRTAIALRGHIGSYVGFDISKSLINQARSFVPDPNFKFFSYDIFSHTYNRKESAILPEKFKFPFPNDSFDVVIASSVFTHLLPTALKNYVSEIRRVLSPKGRCFISFFVEQNKPISGDKWKEAYAESRFHQMNDSIENSSCTVLDPANPDIFVRYNLSYLNQVFKESGLVPLKEPMYGKWNGNPDGYWYQDILTYVKEK